MVNDESFDIEIGILDEDKKQYVASSVNHYLDIENHRKDPLN